MGRHRLIPDAKDPALVCGVLMDVASWSLNLLGTAPICQRVVRGARMPAFSAAVIAPLVLATAGGAAPRLPVQALAVRHTEVVPAAAVTAIGTDPLGPAVVAVERPSPDVHIAVEMRSVDLSGSANDVGVLGIPAIALSAYRNAERMMAASEPGCGLSWNLLAGVGRIESMHANRGATDADGTAVQPIYGPVLDGTLPGNEVVIQTNAAGQATYARAMGPMQFLPGTWARYAADGNGDGVADPQSLYDSTVAAARYLCSGGLDLREPLQLITAMLRYNNSMPYVRNVLGWADAYATGVVPVDLPPIDGSAPQLVDVHWQSPGGLGPGLPGNVYDLPSTGELAQTPLIDCGLSDEATDLLAQNLAQNFEQSEDPSAADVDVPAAISDGEPVPAGEAPGVERGTRDVNDSA